MLICQKLQSFKRGDPIQTKVNPLKGLQKSYKQQNAKRCCFGSFFSERTDADDLIKENAQGGREIVF